MDRLTEYLQDRPRDAVWYMDAVLVAAIVLIVAAVIVFGAWLLASFVLSGFGAAAMAVAIPHREYNEREERLDVARANLQERAAMTIYTGPERRWMTGRSLYGWTMRSDHHNNKCALDEARDVAVLGKLHRKAAKAGRQAEADALWSGLWELKQKLDRYRLRVAEETNPWFDGSAFGSEVS